MDVMHAHLPDVLYRAVSFAEGGVTLGSSFDACKPSKALSLSSNGLANIAYCWCTNKGIVFDSVYMPYSKYIAIYLIKGLAYGLPRG